MPSTLSIRMFKYLLLKSIYDVSDVDVVERSKYDISFKYFLDMAPEEDVIEPSSITKFRKLRLPLFVFVVIPLSILILSQCQLLLSYYK